MSITFGPGIAKTPVAGTASGDTSTADQAPIVTQAVSGQTLDQEQWQDLNGNILTRVDLRGREYSPGAGAPGAVAGANAGTSPPAPVVTAGASDTRGNITFGTGSAPGSGAQVVVTFQSPWVNQAGSNVTPFISVTPQNTATQALGLHVTSKSATGFTLSCTTAPAASQPNTTYSFDFIVTG